MSPGTKVFISGGGGFIASHLVAALPSSWEVTVHVRTPERARPFPERPGLRIVTGGMRQRDLVEEFGRGVDVVMHLAGAVQGPSWDPRI